MLKEILLILFGIVGQALNGKIISKVWNDINPILKEYHEKNGEFSLAGMPYTQAYDKIDRLISGITNGSSRIQKIVESLKDFARQDKGDLNQKVDINKVVESSIFLLDNMIKKSTDHFSVEYDKLPIIKGNFQQLEQVIINFITNSCQALENKKKCIQIITNHDRDLDCVMIKVQDEGLGIPPEYLQNIMDPFFTTKRDSEGTGLGLSISYTIAKDHGGKLKISSEEGKGTTAILILPVNQGVKHETS